MDNKKISISFLKEGNKKGLLITGSIFALAIFNFDLFNINIRIKSFVLGVLFYLFGMSIYFYIKKYKKYVKDVKTKISEIEYELESLSKKIDELKHYKIYLKYVDDIYNLQEARDFYYIKVAKQEYRYSLYKLKDISFNLAKVVVSYYDLAIKMSDDLIRENEAKKQAEWKKSWKSYTSSNSSSRFNSNVSKEDKYLNILGLSSNFNLDMLKKTYRTLAKKYHPDCATGNSKKFKEITEAYSYLKEII